MDDSTLVLDRDVRTWVLIPLTISVMLMQLLRQYATQVGAERASGGGVMVGAQGALAAAGAICNRKRAAAVAQRSAAQQRLSAPPSLLRRLRHPPPCTVHITPNSPAHSPSHQPRAATLRLPRLLQLLTGPGKPSQPPKASELREKAAVGRAQVLRTNTGFIPEGGFLQRRAFFLAKVGGGRVVGGWWLPGRRLLGGWLGWWVGGCQAGVAAGAPRVGCRALRGGGGAPPTPTPKKHSRCLCPPPGALQTERPNTPSPLGHSEGGNVLTHPPTPAPTPRTPSHCPLSLSP